MIFYRLLKLETAPPLKPCVQPLQLDYSPRKTVRATECSEWTPPWDHGIEINTQTQQSKRVLQMRNEKEWTKLKIWKMTELREKTCVCPDIFTTTIRRYRQNITKFSAHRNCPDCVSLSFYSCILTYDQTVFLTIFNSYQNRFINKTLYKMPVDLLNPSPESEASTHKLKRLVQSPNSFFMDIKCPGCFQITTVFSHAQTVVVCGSCNVMLCQPTGGRARLTEGCSYRKKVD